MYRKGCRHRDLAVSVRSRSGEVGFDDRECVDDGRGKDVKSCPCELKLHKELWLKTELDGFKEQKCAGFALGGGESR